MKVSGAFSGYSTSDIARSRKFYQEILGLDVEDSMGGFGIHFASGQQVFIYPKPDHQPASYTVLNLVVENINEAVDELVEKKVKFEHYDTMPAKQDERGILRGKDVGMGPNIAWFKDPDGNIVALVED